jgi:membrane-associated PAP2 superfamily phosphatase
MVFYTGPKTLIWILAIALLVLACVPAVWRAKLPFPKLENRDLWITIGTLAISPLLIATSKATTNVFTPHETRRYDGFAPYVKVIEAYPDGDRPTKRGRGFPAGHASGGFALMALAGFARTRRGRGLGVVIGLGTGCSMGLYQIFKGAHYLSHTVVTTLLCWIVFLVLRKLFRADVKPRAAG